MKNSGSVNRLIYSSSLYLQQHAYNPVDWYPWEEEAFEQARKENKPILLSIGYSACHWCHVMAHESFEDTETAECMNKLFINIKVDREERPDIDQIYQTSLQVLSQQNGGWPLTMFLDPYDKMPFYGGTYFPSGRKYGMPAFQEILNAVSRAYQENHSELTRQKDQLQKTLSFLQNFYVPRSTIFFDKEIFAKAVSALKKSFDEAYGGFGSSPKFPSPHTLRFLWEEIQSPTVYPEETQILKKMLNKTLEKMSQGGIFDHIGGGFFRYSVDERWEIPHFEKMLYDNGQLLAIYAMTQCKEVGNAIVDWVLKSMEDPKGGYYASLDADSGGREGEYYCWRKEELQEILDPQEFLFLCRYFNLSLPPNFERKWHLYRELSIPPKEMRTYYFVQEKLLNKRNERMLPACNQQLLVSWNSLMISGMVCAGRAFGNHRFIHSALRAVDRIMNEKFEDKRIHTKLLFLEDYAYLLVALLSLLQVSWRTSDLHLAIKVANILCEQFLDNVSGGFFLTACYHEKLIYRPKPILDNVMPSGNGMAALGLLQLGYLLGETRYLTVAENTLKYAWQSMKEQPHLHTTLLLALKEYFAPTSMIILIGRSETLAQWKKVLQASQKKIFIIQLPEETSGLPDSLLKKKWPGFDVAYWCKGTKCYPAYDNLEKLLIDIESLNKD